MSVAVMKYPDKRREMVVLPYNSRLQFTTVGKVRWLGLQIANPNIRKVSGEPASTYMLVISLHSPSCVVQDPAYEILLQLIQTKQSHLQVCP